MIRYTLLSLFIAFFSLYAFKNWFRGLLGLIFLVSLMERPDMPEAMFGINGVSPYNFLLLCILIGFATNAKQELAEWRISRPILRMMLVMLALFFLSFFRMLLEPGYLYEYSIATQGYSPSYLALFNEHILSSLKAVIPGFLLLFGLNSERRFQELMAVMTAVLVMLALQVLKTMPLTLLADGSALEKRAARVMDRDVGYHRNQLSVWMASAFWFMWCLAAEVKQNLFKYGLIAASFLMFLALIMTGSRGGLLVWAVIGFIFAWLRWRHLVFIAPVIVLLAVGLVPALQERLFESGQTEKEVLMFQTELAPPEIDYRLAAASAGRTIFWHYVYQDAKKAPLLGRGKEAMIRRGITLKLYQIWGPSMAARHPHNAYIQLTHEMGIIGAVLILAFFAVVALRALKLAQSDNERDRLVGGIGISWTVGYLVSGLTASTFYPNEGSIFFWCSVCIVLRHAFTEAAPRRRNLVLEKMDANHLPTNSRV